MQGIDANATSVSIIVDFKRLTIQVIDNGEGITPKDLENIAKLQYTSKWNPQDPKSTLGYKGLALASIATLSRVVINSRHAMYGTTKSVRINFGERTPVYNSTEPRSKPGTSISVAGLFAQMPARQKHAQSISAAAQIEHLKKAIAPIAISRPNVTLSFHDTSNKSLLHILGSSVSSDPRDVAVLQAIHGSHIADRWQTIHTKVKGIDIRATIGFDPVKTKQPQYIIVNAQRIDNPKLYNDLNNLLSALCSLRDFSGSTRYMAYVFEINYDVKLGEYVSDPISLEIPTPKLEYIGDVLVLIVQKFLKAHGYSTKKQKVNAIKPSVPKPRPVLTDSLVHSGVRQARFDLKEKSGRLTLTENNKENEYPHDSFKDEKSHKHSGPTGCCTKCAHLTPKERISITPNTQTLLPDNFLSSKEAPDKCKESELSKYFLDAIENHRQSPDGISEPLEQKFSKSDFASLKLVSQVDDKFLLVTIDNSVRKTKCVAIIDQHAADERVKLESLLSTVTPKSLQINSVPLRDYWESKISEQEYHFFENNGALYSQFGILYRLGYKSGNKTKPFLQLTHIPELGMGKVDTAQGIDPKFAHDLVFSYARDIMDKKVSSLPISTELEWSASIRNYPVALIELFQSKACRSAIMFGKRLSARESNQLIRNLSNCKFPFQCAHGRPSIVPLLDLTK